MKICLYGSTSSWTDSDVQYTARHVLARYPGSTVVLVNSEAPEVVRMARKRRWRKLRKLSMRNLIGRALFQPVLSQIREEFKTRSAAGIARLQVPIVTLPEPVALVPTVNGKTAQTVLSQQNADIVLQIGAGILDRQIYEIPKQGTLNIHHGYLPLIRGGHSVLWAMIEDRKDWLGVTVHWIDKGIDTGGILARYQLCIDQWQHPSDLFVELVQTGTALLMDVLEKLESGDFPLISTEADATGVYRSFIGGWEARQLRRKIDALS